VWIGQNSVILPGVRIGDGVIIGMESVVGSDVEPYTIVAGNPARMIRRRFDEELTGLLLKLKWWDLPAEEIMTLIPLLHDNNTENVKKKLKEILK
jgi:virginiamycin A acetyltransferase